MTYAEAQPFFTPTQSTAERITRYAVTGGMARYLAELGEGGSLKALVCQKALNFRGQLFDDPRVVLQQELRQPATYFSILETLAEDEYAIDTLTNRLGIPHATLGRYLTTLEQMRVLTSELPATASSRAKGRRYKINDGFIRFWFRFIFPHQDGLSLGLPPEKFWDGEISEFLPDHVSLTFEALCQRYTRMRFGAEAPTVGRWWGPALNTYRRSGQRQTEEIDLVGLQRKRLRLIGECKWTKDKMSAAVLDGLLEYKLPALMENTNVSVTNNDLQILLFSRAGFDHKLHVVSQDQANIHLIDLKGLDQVLLG